MATENTKDDAHNEEKVDDLTSDKADPTRLVDLLVSDTGAAHTHSESKLDVVHEHDDHCHDDGPQELVLSHMISAFDLEMSRQTWITLDKHVVGASENHEVDDKNQVPDAEDDASDRIISLGYVDGLLDATPLFIWLLRSRTSELTEPVDQDTSDEVGLVELCHRISEKAWSINVDRVHWIVEEEKEASESHGTSLFKRQLSLQGFWNAAADLRDVHAHDNQADNSEDRAEDHLVLRELRVHVGDVEVDRGRGERIKLGAWHDHDGHVIHFVIDIGDNSNREVCAKLRSALTFEFVGGKAVE